MWLRKKEKLLKRFVRFHSANKTDNYNRVGGKGKKKKRKSRRIYRTSQNIIIVNVFLGSLLSESFPSLGVTVHLTSLDSLQHCADLWTCCGGCSNSNLLLLLCVLASNVHSYQNQCVFFCESSQWPFIYSTDRVCLVDHLDLICNLYSWWEGFESSSLVTLPLGFTFGFISPLHVDHPLGFAPEALLVDWGLH